VCGRTDWNLAVYNDLLCKAHFDRIGLEHGFFGCTDERRLRGLRGKHPKRETGSGRGGTGEERDKWGEGGR